MKQKATYLILCLLVLATVGVAQTPQQVEDSVNNYLSTIATAAEDGEKRAAHNALSSLLRRSLLKPEVYHHPFDQTNRMAVLGDVDADLRLWSWHVPLEDAADRYGAVIARWDARKEMVSVHVLEQAEEAEYSEQAVFGTKNWPGALYFRLVPVGKGPDYYLLFGWDAHDAISNKKVVEVLSFKRDFVQLGQPVFVRDGKTQHRLVFEYREDAVFSVDYYPERDMIIHEDLGPTHPSLEGKTAHYVPLRSFSGYARNKKRWEYQGEVDFKRGKDQRDKFFNDPEDADMNRERDKTNPLIGE